MSNLESDQTRFVLFTMALQYSILGLAIQTAPVALDLFSLISELLGWFFLLLSAFLISDLVESLFGSRIIMAENSQYADNPEFTKGRDEAYERDGLKATLRRYFFIIGVILVILSRVYIKCTLFET